MSTIYTHPHCPTYTHTPLEMLTHLRTSHPALSASTAASHGTQGLDALLHKHRLHLTPHAFPRMFPCAACALLHTTSFAAQRHLESDPAHAAAVHRAREDAGSAGVAALIETAWVEPLECVMNTPSVVKHKYTNEVYVNEEQGQLNIAQHAGAPAAAGVPAARGPVDLTLQVANYTTRQHYPAEVTLRVAVPRGTGTVAALAACVEAAWVRQGGAPGKVAWARMVAAVGVRVPGWCVVRDEQVAAWVGGAEGAVDGRLGA